MNPITFNLYIHQQNWIIIFIKTLVQTGDGMRECGGCNLCKSVPQKGQQGVDKFFSSEDSMKDLKSEGYPKIVNKTLGGNFVAHLLQHMQCQEGLVGRICRVTAHLSSLCLWLHSLFPFPPEHIAYSVASNGTTAEQKLHSSSSLYSKRSCNFLLRKENR